MKLTEIFKNRKKEKQIKLRRLVDYLDEHIFEYHEVSEKLQKENASMQKFLTNQYNILQKKYVFDELDKFKSENKKATYSDLIKLEEKCLKNLDLAYENLKEKTTEEFLEKNDKMLDFVKTYAYKMKEYEKLQVELKVQIPLKQYVPFSYANDDRLI